MDAVRHLRRQCGLCRREAAGEGAWECLESRPCLYAYSYGGDTFCKFPSEAVGGPPHRQSRVIAYPAKRGRHFSRLSRFHRARQNPGGKFCVLNPPGHDEENSEAPGELSAP
jgi:hypothetical protein